MLAFRNALAACPLVAILRGIRPEECIGIGTALVGAGFTIIEVPLNSPDPYASIALLSREFGTRTLVGAGTVIDPKQVVEVAQAGGRLIVMPHADARVVVEAKALGLINRVVAPSQLQAETMALAQIIASKPRTTVRTGKEAFYRQIEMPLADAYDYASRVMTENMLNAEAEEGICAFLEKRDPQWPA